MGSWNETCNLTHLPIMCGERVRVLLIAGKNNPLFYPFEGVYNDYGAIEGIAEDVNTEHIFETITRNEKLSFMFSFEEFQKPDHDAAMESFEGLVKAVEREIVHKFNFITSRTVPVSMVFFKDEVYRRVLKTIETDVCWNGETTLSIYEKEQEKAREDKKRWEAAGISGNPLCEFKLNMCYVWHEHFKFDVKAGFENAMSRMMDLKLLMNFYSGTRRDIDTVQMGRGSQGEEFDFWEAMNKIMLEQCDKEHQKRHKEMDEDE